MNSWMKSARLIYYYLSAFTPFILSGCVFGNNQAFFGAEAATSSGITANLPANITFPSSTASPSPLLNPVAVNAGPYEMSVNSSLSISTASLLVNDTDPQNLPLHYVSFQSLSSGTMTLSGSNLIFTPNTNFVGTVTFTYEIANSANLSAEASVTINVRTPASEPIYAQSANHLYSYDAEGKIATLIGTFTDSDGSIATVFDIAITPTGLLYGVDGSALYYINASTSQLTLIPTSGLTEFGNINGLTALSDGRLVIAGNGLALYEMDTHTLTTLVEPNEFQTSGDIIALPDGYLYWSVNANAGAGNELLKVDPNTGATTHIGTLSYSSVWGLGYANGSLYGFDESGAIFSIDPTTAQATLQTNTGIGWYGATTNPVLW